MSPTESLLKDYLNEGQPDAADVLLSRLVFDTAEPVIRRILYRRLGPDTPAQDREDLSGDIMLDLVSRLQSAKSGESKPIENYQGYIAVAAYHACDQYLRRRYPQRHRLRNRVRYLLEHTKGFAVWEDEQGELIAGRAQWRGKPPLRALPPDWEANVARPAGQSPVDAVEAVFARLNGPMPLESLVTSLAQFWGVKDQQVAWEDVEQRATSPEIDAGRRIDERRALERVWHEVGELPPQQRVALLLNLRDESGASALVALPAAGVASIRQIAASLSIAIEEFAALWQKLPLSDLDIAARLGLTRQQVINLRKSARQRLARRMGEKALN